MQRSFADLGQPLFDVTFCVIDLETTGASASTCGITEVGAVRYRGGECLGTFSTLVNPGIAIPPEITVLTGISQSMVMQAPRIEQVLPSLLEFIGGAVIVGHNVRFDTGFLDAALARSGRDPLSNRRVDTVALARRLVRDEVPNCRLGTLADRLGLPHRPNHRALDDAMATADLLHLLLERVGRLGVTGLDDLLALPKLAGHPQAQKLALTDRLPRSPGAYLFRDIGGRVLYVGKASNLRSRVRSYFSGDQRRKVAQLLRETHRIDHQVCATSLEAAVLEIRLIHEHQPRFNAQIKKWRSYTYLKLTTERFPRLSITKHVSPDGTLYIGPLSSARVARLVAEAIESAVPIRRCTARVGITPRPAECTPAQLGVATCPCAGSITEDAYAPLVARVVRGITSEPSLLLQPLDDKMRELALSERYEEAAAVRDRAAALASTLDRRRRIERLRQSGRVTIATVAGHHIELDHGLLIDAPQIRLGAEPTNDLALPPARDHIDELLCVARWLDEHADRFQILRADADPTVPLDPVPSFQPTNNALVSSGRYR